MVGCGIGREKVRRRISANFWRRCEISGLETTRRPWRSGKPRSAPAKSATGSSGDASVASSFAVELTAAPVQDDVEIERALVSLGREPRGGLIALPEIFLGSRGTACFRRSVARSRACRCGYACRRRRAGRPRWLWFGVPDRCGCRPRGVTRCAIESAPDAVRDNRCGHEVHKGFSSCRSSAHIGAVHPCVEG
jgi:hypothetical protein